MNGDKMRVRDLINWEHVDRVLIKDWWYNVVPGTFVGTLLDGSEYAEYRFDYHPKARRFGEPAKTMHTSNEQIDAVQYAGGGE